MGLPTDASKVEQGLNKEKRDRWVTPLHNSFQLDSWWFLDLCPIPETPWVFSRKKRAKTGVQNERKYPQNERKYPQNERKSNFGTKWDFSTAYWNGLYQIHNIS